MAVGGLEKGPPGLFMTNLTTNIKEAQLLSWLKNLSPSVFGAESENLRVHVFLPDDRKQSATVFGFSCSMIQWNLLCENSYKQKLNGRVAIIKPDNGDPRDAYGRFIAPIKSSVMRRIRPSICGEEVVQRKVTAALLSDSLSRIYCPSVGSGSMTHSKEIYVRIYDAANIKIMKVNEELRTLFAIPGTLKNCLFNTWMDCFIVMYETDLETVQAFVYFAGLENKLEKNYGHFRFEMLQKISRTQVQKCAENQLYGGIGLDHCIIDCCSEKGIFPLHLFSNHIVDRTKLRRHITSTCWRCKARNSKVGTFSPNHGFKLTGVDVNFKYFTGVCGCKYVKDTETDDSLFLDKNNAYQRPGEQFTRLILGYQTRGDSKLSFNLEVLHSPMQISYNSKPHYSRILIPIIQAEWKDQAADYQIHQTQLTPINFIKIEQVDTNEPKSNPKIVYVMEGIVKATKFWSVDNSSSIKDITLLLDGAEKRRGNVCRIEQHSMTSSSSIRLFIKFATDTPLRKLQRISFMEIIPKPDKKEYDTQKKTLNKFAQGDMNFSQLGHFLGTDNSTKLDIERLQRPDLPNTTKIKIVRILQQLNDLQIEGIMKAENQSMTVIQGPPGTGKTKTSASVVSILALREKGKILVCTPSNVAANGVAEAIAKVIRTHQLEISVIRMLSKRRERFLAAVSEPDYKATTTESYNVLHQLVRQSTKWKEEAYAIDPIHDPNTEWYLMTEENLEKLDLLVSNIEQDIFEKTDIIVCTINCSADHRLTSSSGITTILVDECAQSVEPTFLSLFFYKPARMILVGDHQQLNPTVLSFAAKTAGLHRSFMQRLSMMNNDRPNDDGGSSSCSSSQFWTTLLLQYRMPPTLRQLVSKFSYSGNLEDGVIDRTDNIIDPKTISKFPGLAKSSIIMFDHTKFEDPRDDHQESSISNMFEVDKCEQLVRDLMDSGVAAKDITILTMYELQRSHISRRLNKIDGVMVHNVDDFQGRENKFIVLSLVRSNTKQSHGFLKQQNRINVAISRAIGALFVIGNLDFFLSSENLVCHTFAKLVKEHATIVKV